MRAVICQIDIAWEDKAANHDKVAAMLAASPPPAGALVVLPEMFATGFSMDVARVDDGEGGPTARFLAEQARRHGATVVGGLATRGPDGRGRNESHAYGPDGQLVARYRKMRPFCFGEQEHYAAGDRTVLFEWRSGGEHLTVAPFVCYDLRFPELFRAAARRGAQLLTVIANWPVARIEHWTTLVKARAIENQAFVVGVNRCGSDPTLTYTGGSLIVAPSGEVLADARDGEGLVSAEIEPAALVEYRQKLPFLADLHPDYVRDEERQT